MPAWKRWATLVFFAVALALPLRSDAQGCSLCKDATVGSAPRQRQAFRRAILIMGYTSCVIFLGILAVARRIKPRDDSELANQL